MAQLLHGKVISGHGTIGLRSQVRWVEEYHVDGFRFDLASCLCRDSNGTPLEVPPIIRDIAKDPVLSKVWPTDIHALAHHLCKVAPYLPEHLGTMQCQ